MRYYEIKLFELNDKVKENLRFKFKRENENLTDAQIDYYLDRWDRYVNNFELQYRDITRLTFSQVEALIDDSETKTQLKGTAKPKKIFDQNDDLIYNKNNLVILKGDLKEKCIQYGSGYSWCISRSDASNMFYSYRMRMNEPMFYFVFDKDRSETDIWHAVVIYVDSNNIFHVATSNNPGDVQMTWDEIVSKQPKLAGLEELFVHQPLTQEEKSDYQKYRYKVDLTTYSNFSLKEKYKYIQFGHKLSDDQQDATPNELIGVYAKQMPIHISSSTWNRLGGSDRRVVEEGRLLHAVQRDGAAISDIINPSEAVQLAAVRGMQSEPGEAIRYIKNPSEAVQLAAVSYRGRAIRYIKNPSEAVQLAAVQQDGNAIYFIDNPSEEVKLAAKRNQL